MAGLNNNHRRFLLISCQHIDKQLASIEAMLGTSAGTAFPRYVDDLTPTQKQVVRDYMTRIRERLLVLLEQFEMRPEPASIPASWGARTTMLSICNTLEDMNPRHMRGYGDLDEATGQRMDAVVAEIDQPLTRLLTYIGQRQGRDPQERLASLEAAGRLPPEELKTLERIISAHGLVEFRPTLDSILDHLETSCFEIAVFGRVSSGKSSLLNQILGAPVLPVGVTPITAVPTRITAGETPAAVVRFAEGKPREIVLEQLTAFASEEGNPGNTKHVTELLVRFPSPRLHEGFVFIDTPGIGSLANHGEAEALAYLPRCDLGIVLLDSAVALNQEDVNLLRLLYDAGISALVLLSKCDLLSPDDRVRMSRYVEEQLARQAGLKLPAQPVSTVGPDVAFLDQWFNREIQPLYEQQQSLVQRAVHRKTGLLLESVRAALAARVSRSSGRGGPPGGGRAPGRLSPEEAAALEQALQRASRGLEVAQARARRAGADLIAQEESLLEETAAAIAARSARQPRQPLQLEQSARERVLHWLDRQGRGLAAEIADLRSELGKPLATLQKALIPTGDITERPLLPELYGLPIPDLAPLRIPATAAPPPLLAGIAPLRRRVIQSYAQELLRQPLHDLLTLHARRLQEWAVATVARLDESYQEQEAMYREAIREPSRPWPPLRGGAPSVALSDNAQLHHDLQALDRLIADTGQPVREEAVSAPTSAAPH